MNKKGFTLIEILATLFVLALISLIIVPIVSDIMNKIKKRAFENSIYGLIESVDVYYNDNLKDNDEYLLIEIENGKIKNDVNLQYKGSLDIIKGGIAVTEDGEVAICAESEKYFATKSTDSTKVKIKVASGDLDCVLPGPKDGENITFTLNATNKQDGKCETNKISDKLKYKEDILNGATPELYEGMIPIVYKNESGTIKAYVANVKEEWYSYKEHKWANAVLVDYSNKIISRKYFNDDMTIKASVIGEEINEDEILQYYVWIPRYKYKLWNVEGGLNDPRNIQIIFESNKTKLSFGTKNGEYRTHSAFSFGNNELNGIWIGKFETNGTIQKLTIKPNITALRNLNVRTFFDAVRNMETTYSYLYGINSNEIDTHLIKSLEWGAMAYLSSSKYGRYDYTEDNEELATTCTNGSNSADCEIWINCNSGYLTGCACATYNAAGSGTCNKWDTSLGMEASTTNNIYGIYDISGGSWEYAMGSMMDANNNFVPSESGFLALILDNKYVDMYPYSDACTSYHIRGKFGDATFETLKIDSSANGSWNNDYSYFVCTSGYYMVRGGQYSDTNGAGIFARSYTTGKANGSWGFRNVIVGD